jgi:hypothetical protein
MRRLLLGAALVTLLLLGSAGAVPTGAASHYVPRAGDSFAYTETITVTNGTGDYAGYTETSAINGSLTVTAVAPNDTASASYYSRDVYTNDSGGNDVYVESGTFSFSASTFLYVHGTDGQSGANGSEVWFYIDNTAANGTPISLVGTPMTIESTDVNYALGTAAGNEVVAVYALGSGTYTRNDSYGTFSAQYVWKAFYDPSTGYVIGYSYSEEDTNSSSSFSYLDVLKVTSTTYPLTVATSPPSGGSSSSSGSTLAGPLVIGAIALVVLVVIVVVIVLVLRSRHRGPGRLPTHSARGQVRFPTSGPPPGSFGGAPPPPVSLTPSGQPAVQQIVIKETVKVNCRYCGALIDTTAEKCPFCGANRT